MSYSQLLPFDFVSLLTGVEQITIVNDNARRPAISATSEKLVRDYSSQKSLSRVGSTPGMESIEVHPCLINRWSEIYKLPQMNHEDNSQEQKLSPCSATTGFSAILQDRRPTKGSHCIRQKEEAALSKSFDASPKIPCRQESLDDPPDDFEFYLNLLHGRQSRKCHRSCTAKPKKKRTHSHKTIDFSPKIPYRQESLDD